jgi:short-subunit dehydrogenase
MSRFAFISGATGFVGLKLAEHLASQGKDLILSGRNEDQLNEVVENISMQYGNQTFRGLVCDLANPAAWYSATEELQEFSVDQYINCSGIQGKLGPSPKLSHEDMMEVFNVNLFSGIYFTNFFVNRMRASEKLSIIHFSGGGSTSPRPLFMSYSLSKTSLLRYVENVSAENTDKELRINAIAPGVLPSKMHTQVLANQSLRDSKDYLVSLNTLSSDENYNSEKLLNLCDFLLGDKSEGITGKLISAEWDNWAEWPNHLDKIKNSDLFTLRRISGRDRGQEWGDI